MAFNRTLFGIVVLTPLLALSAPSHAGNERGGGVPPAPVFMSEDASYQCTVALTQLNKELERALISRGSAVLELFKGKEAVAYIKIGDIPGLKHYQLTASMGPFRPTEREVSPAPKAATFEDSIVLQGRYGGTSMGIQLRAVTESAGVSSEAFDFATLESRLTLETKVIQHKTGPEGLEDRIFDITCRRVK